MTDIKYKRVLMKLSGEALAGDKGQGIDLAVVSEIAQDLKEVHDLGTQIAIVVGGGNLWRGEPASKVGMERSRLVLQDALERAGVDTRVQTAITMQQIAEPYIRGRAIRHLEKGRIVIFAAGTGSPYFSTDTTAALRANEINADAILMGKNGVDGVYDSDPNKNADAVKFTELTHLDILQKGLKVMDSTASSLSMDNNMPLVVFNLNTPGNLKRVVLGENIGTTVTGGK